jgi:hypothetical protein
MKQQEINEERAMQGINDCIQLDENEASAIKDDENQEQTVR